MFERNLLRRPGRSAMTIAAVAISMALLLSMLSIAEGMLQNAKEDLKVGKGDVIVIPYAWAINIAATASYKAVPSILIVAPRGRTKLATFFETPTFFSKQSMVIGSVAALLAVL